MSSSPDSSRFPDLSRLGPGDRVGIDTETTGTTWRDFPVGMSLALPDGSDWYLAWGHEADDNNCTLDEVRRWAEAEMRDDVLFAHFNAPFEFRMLTRCRIRLPARIGDGAICAPLINELEREFNLDYLCRKYLGPDRVKDDKALNEWCARRFGGPATRRAQAGRYWRAPVALVAPYAKADARNHVDLFGALRPIISAEGLDGVHDMETALVPILNRMHQVGVRVDVPAARALKKVLTDKLELATAEWRSRYGDVNINSTPQLAPLFRAHGLQVGKTDAGNESITADVELKQDHDVCRLITLQKQLEKFSGVFIDSYLLENVDDRGFIHGQFHALKGEEYGTVSGRFSSANPLNLQNLPARDGELAPLIRGLFVPLSDEHQWLKLDYSQIEYRFLAHYAGGGVARRYIEDPTADFHQMVADMAGIKRGPAKTTNFAVVYGQGVKATALQLGKTIDEAKAFLADYFGRVPEVKELKDKAERVAGSRGHIVTWGGRKRRFMPIEEAKALGWNVKYDRGKYVGTHAALNGLLQGSAADLIKRAMVKVCAERQLIDWDVAPLHLTVHDELDPSVERGDAGLQRARRIKEAMQDFTLDSGVPIIAEASLGPDWGHCSQEV